MAENASFSTMTTKQKVIGILTLVIIGFIIYEVIGLFSSDHSSKTVITPTQQNTAAAVSHKQTQQTAATSNSAGNVVPGASPAQQSTPTTLAAVSPLSPPDVNMDAKQEQQQQQNYLDSVNQLQLLKVKREIAETNQAIATARLATETANKSMSDLLTQPTLPPTPMGTYATNLASPNGGTIQTSAQNPEASAAPKAAPQPAEVQFVVISVSMQFERWNAVLGYQGKMYSVSIGDTLFDGSTVSSINKNGVTLMKEGKKQKIEIQTTI